MVKGSSSQEALARASLGGLQAAPSTHEQSRHGHDGRGPCTVI